MMKFAGLTSSGAISGHVSPHVPDEGAAVQSCQGEAQWIP